MCGAMMLSTTGAMAQTKTTKTAKTSKTAKAKASKKAKTVKMSKLTPAKKAVTDTVSLSDFSYDMGLVQTTGLKQYIASRMNVDTTKMDDFMKGLNEMMANPDNKSLAAYAAGIQIGQQLMGQILPSLNKRITDKDNTNYIDAAKFKAGFTDGIAKKGTVSLDSATKVVEKQMTFYHARLMEQKYGDNRVAGEKFLAENAKKPGVKTLPGSTVQYKVIKEGNGAIPTATDEVEVNYEGKLIDGTVFDSSYKRNKPATFECDRVIKGWTEALTHMPVGSTWEIYIPQELAYGDREAGGKIKPFSALIFKVELLSIKEKNKAGSNATKK